MLTYHPCDRCARFASIVAQFFLPQCFCLFFGNGEESSKRLAYVFRSPLVLLFPFTLGTERERRVEQPAGGVGLESVFILLGCFFGGFLLEEEDETLFSIHFPFVLFFLEGEVQKNTLPADYATT